MLTQLGERIKLARRRRKLSTLVVSQRAGISRTTVYKVEAGEPGVTMGTYLRVLATLGLDGDLDAVASDDKVGRTLQDHGLLSPSAPKQPLKAPPPPSDAINPSRERS